MKIEKTEAQSKYELMLNRLMAKKERQVRK